MKRIKLKVQDIQRMVKKVLREQEDTSTSDNIENLSDKAEELEFQAENLEADIYNYIDDLELEIKELQYHHEEDDGNLTEALERSYEAAANADKSGDELDMVIYYLENYMDSPGNYFSNTGPRDINEDHNQKRWEFRISYNNAKDNIEEIFNDVMDTDEINNPEKAKDIMIDIIHQVYDEYNEQSIDDDEDNDDDTSMEIRGIGKYLDDDDESPKSVMGAIKYGLTPRVKKG